MLFLLLLASINININEWNWCRNWVFSVYEFPNYWECVNEKIVRENLPLTYFYLITIGNWFVFLWEIAFHLIFSSNWIEQKSRSFLVSFPFSLNLTQLFIPPSPPLLPYYYFALLSFTTIYIIVPITLSFFNLFHSFKSFVLSSFFFISFYISFNLIPFSFLLQLRRRK